ncbi:response regulator [Candidatus Halobeggiatoa sp. HSG11]|nr:response regulator [Candidatus Halobeggiatoa sp. HSG11]
MRLRSKLLLQSVFTIVLLSVVSGGIGFYYTHNVVNISSQLVEGEAIPALRIKQLEKIALEVWLRLILHGSTTNMDTMEQVETELPQLKQEMNTQIAYVGDRYINHVLSDSELDNIVEIENWKKFQTNWKNFTEVIKQALYLSQEFEKKEAMELILNGEVRTAYNQIVASLDLIINTHQEHIEKLRSAALSMRQQSFWTIISLTVAVALIALIFITNFSRKFLFSPLQHFQDGLLDFFAYLNRETDTAKRITINSHDELGQMSQLVNKNIENIEQGMVQDNKLIAEVADIVSKIKMGNLQDKIAEVANNPALNELKNLLNELLTVIEGVLADVGSSLNQLANGNLDARVTSNYAGEYARLQQSCNGIANQIQTIFNETNTVLDDMAYGNMQTRINGDFAGDFVGIKTSANKMAEKLQQLIQEVTVILSKLADGNTDIQIQGEFLGDFGEIKTALEITTTKLSEATTQNEKQNWLKTGQSQLSKHMSGEKTIVKLAEDIINFLTPYLEAQVGAFYLAKENDNDEIFLKMIASHAYIWRKNSLFEFKIGEGIVGQAALEHKLFVTAEAPDDYISIQSGLGATTPKAILVAPFLYENNLKGVIEIASFGAFNELQLDFLKQALSMIAVAVNTAESHTKMQTLLQQSQTQSEELQNQQSELKNSNEELQSQSEELQTQQEELRQTNEILEERTRGLEQQKIEVQNKNQALEINRIEMEKAQTAIALKAEELELASKYKSEFLANMSHELRTPLNSLLILAELMADNKPGNLTEKQIEYAQTISSAGKDLLTLINDILDLSKVEAGKIEIQWENIIIRDLLTTIKQKFVPIAEHNSLQFKTKVADDIPKILSTDSQRVKQVINNLLSNALKFTAEGEVSITIQYPTEIPINIGGNSLEKTIAIVVQDSGIGIPKDKQQSIFEAFQQADGSTSRRYGGTGLGLSISRQLARLLGGELMLTSEENQGSTFTLYLPEKKPSNSSANSAPISTPEKPPVVNKEQPNKEYKSPAIEEKPLPSLKPIPDDRNDLKVDDKSILFIEDDRKFSNILMELALENNFKCLLAEDGIAGVQLAEKYNPSAIILDIGLPELNGWSVMERLKDNPNTRHIPVHFMSAADDQSMDAKKMGAIGYLLKPVTMEKLGEAFKKIESFLSETVKKMLIVADNETHQQKIIELVGNDELQIQVAVSTANACQELQITVYDCVILDMDVEQNSGGKFLEKMQQAKNHPCQIPIIVYANRDLTTDEEALLMRCSDEIPIKSVSSPERLLDEATLFLHQIESKLPIEKRNMLKVVHDKEAILKDKRVLIIDDDVRNVYALATVLEECDMEVICATNGKNGLDKLQQEEGIAIVLMDIMMPEMDGYEAMRNIRKQSKYHKLPIIALTAKAMKDDKAKCIEAGANDYLTKPVDADKLMSLMRVWLYR